MDNDRERDLDKRVRDTFDPDEPRMLDRPALAADQKLDHRPERWYYEHDSCVDPDALADILPETLSDEDEQIAADYESAYYDSHFYASDDDFQTCERAFEGFACRGCSEDEDRFVAWPCEFGDASLPLPEPHDAPPDLPERLRLLAAVADGVVL